MAEEVIHLANQHNWAATGVADYPPRNPLVGQGTFFHRYRTFIKTVDHEDDRFAHVFAVEGDWGWGKSRLGQELNAQINDCSKGWFVRTESGDLERGELFDSEERRDQYLGLYIRYSKIASEYQNADNWFGFGLYKALIPLALDSFDESIQGTIAGQAVNRLKPLGFEPGILKECLQLEQGYTDRALYYDEAVDAEGNPVTVVELVNAAYEYLKRFGIEYVLIVLDELETVAESATFGLEREEETRLDGQAIRLIGQAIKEEDPRRKLPWLRYVALCSPLLGQQLREIQSTARRFELVELESSAFADVSDYVRILKQESRLRHDYPTGLVEAAYAMSGGNFGWFNVIMANIDAVLDDYAAAGKAVPPLGELFGAVLRGSGRVSKHVLDVNALEGLKTSDRELKGVAESLLYGQLPRPLEGAHARLRELLTLYNEFDEPVAGLYCKVDWDLLKCRQAMEQGKFVRDRDRWMYHGVEQGLNLKALLQNLKTFSINESGGGANSYLIPLSQSEFSHLVSLLYDHPAAEFAANALWTGLMGQNKEVEPDVGTHIGPSVAMLLRLDLRYRRREQNSLIFRRPEVGDAHRTAMQKLETAWERDGQLRYRSRLIGMFRLLDRNWSYSEDPFPNRKELIIQMTPRKAGKSGGLQFCEGLKLHPKSQACFAWVSTRDELYKLNEFLVEQRPASGRIPAVAFTGSIAVHDEYTRGGVDEELKDNILLYYLNTSETDVLERIGIPGEFCDGFELEDQGFTTKFKMRLTTMRDSAYAGIHEWRRRLDQRGLIAWPLRPTAKIASADRQNLFKAWKLLAVDEPGLGGLQDILPEHPVDAAEVRDTFGKLLPAGQVVSQGYTREEQAGLFQDMEHPHQAQARVPSFLARIADPSRADDWTLQKAQQNWYWGYLWSPASTGLSAKVVFDDWMWWCSKLHLLKVEDPAASKPKWIPVTRAELEDGALGHAREWLYNKENGDYRATVDQLVDVYGEDKIFGNFAWKDRTVVGTATTIALERIAAAESLMQELRTREESLPDDLPKVMDAFPALLKGRSDFLVGVSKVKPFPAPRVILGNERMVHLDDDTISLFERIEQARLFADFVRTSAQRIETRAESLIEEIGNDQRAASPFPRRLFTLSLETIRHILSGAISRIPDTETSREEAAGSSDTLRFYLRTLQLDRVTERLELLSREVGVDIRSGACKPVDEVDGYIMTAFRKLLDAYEKNRAGVHDLQDRINTIHKRFEGIVPVDYPDSEHPKNVLRYDAELQLLSESFDDLDEEIDPIRERFAEDARRGRFAGMKDIPERLTKTLREQLGVLGGRVRGVENVISGFRNNKLERLNFGVRLSINHLFKALGRPEIEPVLLDEVDDMSLHDFQVHVDVSEQNWVKEAEEALQETGVSLDRWGEIARLLEDGDQPDLTRDEQRVLVDRGILRVQVAFGGAS